MMKNTIPRILVADDDLGVIAAYRHVLENAGMPSPNSKRLIGLEAELFGVPGQDEGDAPWHVDFVDQGKDAVDAVREAYAKGDPYAAVFLDIRMPPGIDGFEAAQEIRKIDAKVHIVIVSAYSDYSEEELIEVAGPENNITFLEKPVWPDQLLATAGQICQQAASAMRTALSNRNKLADRLNQRRA